VERVNSNIVVEGIELINLDPLWAIVIQYDLYLA
jgi:hypothetical protein